MWGGIHFSFSTLVGARMGDEVADYVTRTQLVRVHRPCETVGEDGETELNLEAARAGVAAAHHPCRAQRSQRLAPRDPPAQRPGTGRLRLRRPAPLIDVRFRGRSRRPGGRVETRAQCPSASSAGPTGGADTTKTDDNARRRDSRAETIPSSREQRVASPSASWRICTYSRMPCSVHTGPRCARAPAPERSPGGSSLGRHKARHSYGPSACSARRWCWRRPRRPANGRATALPRTQQRGSSQS